ncbi:MAG: hypothetical protein KDB00_08755, partial [Planctomycetales bacterium]|nr:hypothetical protein [Planctomycetales bacterium]
RPPRRVGERRELLTELILCHGITDTDRLINLLVNMAFGGGSVKEGFEERVKCIYQTLNGRMR